MTATVTIEVDCHAYAWHVANETYPECGPDNLTRMAEEYGVLIRFLPDHELADWAWWYEITGPPAHVVALMMGEYGAGEHEAREMVGAVQAAQAVAAVRYPRRLTQ
jgi:hypothetical protein